MDDPLCLEVALAQLLRQSFAKRKVRAKFSCALSPLTFCRNVRRENSNASNRIETGRFDNRLAVFAARVQAFGEMLHFRSRGTYPRIFLPR